MGLPQRFVIGSYKCGTTFLSEVLDGHPEIYLPAQKELNAFVGDNVDLDRYARQFRRAGPRAAVDVSPGILPSGKGVSNLLLHVPEARLVALIREPVARAYSDYQMYRRDGREPCPSFLEALALAAGRMAAGDPMGHYIATGLYGKQFKASFPRGLPEQLLVVYFEDLIADPYHAVNSILLHFGLAPFDAPLARVAARNASGELPSRFWRTVAHTRGRLGPSFRPLVPRRMRRAIDDVLTSRMRPQNMGPSEFSEAAQYFSEDVSILSGVLGLAVGEKWLAWKN